LDAWSTAAALARRWTERLELMVAGASHISLAGPPLAKTGRQYSIILAAADGFSLNVVSSMGGRTKPKSMESQFEQHDDRYARTAEWLRRSSTECGSRTDSSFSGKYYPYYHYPGSKGGNPFAPKNRSPRPASGHLRKGGESEAAKKS